MKHRVYYDGGYGQAALLTAGLKLGLLPTDVLPSKEHVAAFLRDHGKAHAQGRVILLGETADQKIYWCGLGRSTTVAVRTWRHFLQLYGCPQADFSFYWVPRPMRLRWRRGERKWQIGQRKLGSEWMAEAAVREYAVFLTVLLTEIEEG